jgi:hypothetical protein
VSEWTVIARASGGADGPHVQMKATPIDAKRVPTSTIDAVKSSAVNAFRWAFDEDPEQVGVGVLPYDPEQDEIEDERIIE